MLFLPFFSCLLCTIAASMEDKSAHESLSYDTSAEMGKSFKIQDLPDSIDWRTEGYVTKVKDQGVCSASYAFAAVGAIEGQVFRKTGVLTPLSARNIVACTFQDQSNRACWGGWVKPSFDYIVRNGGLDTEAAYPYGSFIPYVDLKCEYNASGIGAVMTGYTEFHNFSEYDLMAAVASVGPIAVCLPADDDFQNYKAGVFSSTKCDPFDCRQAGLVVGYGSTDKHEDYWLIKNSFGTDWGEDGYYRLSRKTQGNTCGLGFWAGYPILAQ